jgi:multisubunit Na+/H+ antiporter MnhE subunit
MVRGWLAWWTLSAGLWLALVDNTAVAELAAGAVAAAVAATGAVAVRRDPPRRPPPGWLRVPARAAVSVVAGVGPLVTALVRSERGRIVELPFDRAGDDRWQSLAEALASAGPNAVVLGVDRDRGVLRVHELVPREPSGSPDDPVVLP